MYDFGDIAQAGNNNSVGSRNQIVGRLAFKLILCYLMAAFFCWEEIRFRAAVEVPATLSVVSHQHDGKSTVRYVFTESETGRQHQNTVQIRTQQIPENHEVGAQYIASSNSSRLTIQARPWISWTFFGVNMTLLLIIIGGVSYLAWESTQRMPTRQQRTMAAYHKRKKNDKCEQATA